MGVPRQLPIGAAYGRDIYDLFLREQIVDDERLSTLFCEVESIVNGRPLTVLYDDPNDETPLTPNICYFFVEDLICFPAGLTRVIYMEGVGDMFSSPLTSFGSAGFASIYPLCSYVTSGCGQREICRMEMWS